jgi:hypothetical protein
MPQALSVRFADDDVLTCAVYLVGPRSRARPLVSEKLPQSLLLSPRVSRIGEGFPGNGLVRSELDLIRQRA